MFQPGALTVEQQRAYYQMIYAETTSGRTQEDVEREQREQLIAAGELDPDEEDSTEGEVERCCGGKDEDEDATMDDKQDPKAAAAGGEDSLVIVPSTAFDAGNGILVVDNLEHVTKSFGQREVEIFTNAMHDYCKNNSATFARQAQEAGKAAIEAHRANLATKKPAAPAVDANDA